MSIFKKILLFFFFIGLSTYLTNLGLVKAVSGVTIKLTPDQPTIQTANGIQISASGLISGKQYYLSTTFNQPGNQSYVLSDSRGNQAKVTADSSANPTASFTVCFKAGSFGGVRDQLYIDSNCTNTFPANRYPLILLQDGDGSFAVDASFSVLPKTSTTLQCTNTGFTTSDHIIIQASGLPDGSYKALVNGADSKAGGSCVNSSGGSITYDLGQYTQDTYTVSVVKCGQKDALAQGTFKISNDPSSPGSCSSTPAGTIPNPTPCTGPNCSKAGGESCDDTGKNGPGIKTAIGCIHTSPVAFVKDFMTFIIGISGGLAFLMMLLGAFQMLTSAGNPDTLNAGRERLTSAIIGLLLVIFAVLLLQIIGVSLLNIPGFS